MKADRLKHILLPFVKFSRRAEVLVAVSFISCSFSAAPAWSDAVTDAGNPPEKVCDRTANANSLPAKTGDQVVKAGDRPGKTGAPVAKAGDLSGRTGDPAMKAGNLPGKTGDPVARTGDRSATAVVPGAKLGDLPGKTSDPVGKAGDLPVKTSDTPVEPQDSTRDPRQDGDTGPQAATAGKDGTKAATSKAGTPATQPSGRLRIADMRLSGSMCLACLHELENHLKALAGVSKVKIEYPVHNYYEYFQAPGLGSWAHATINYDPDLKSFDDIRALLKTQGYHPYKIVEKEK